MSDTPESRIREIPADLLSPEQKTALAAVQSGRGRVPAPYKIWLHSPKMMQRLERLGTFLVTESALKPREQELAIMAIAHHWHGDYVFAAHARAGSAAGISDAVIEALRDGKMPALDDARERAVCEIARACEDSTPANDAVFGRAIAALGEDGLADLLVFLGYYSAVAMAMKTFRVPVPGVSARK